MLLLVAAVGGVVLGARRPGAARTRVDRAVRVRRQPQLVARGRLQTAVMESTDADHPAETARSDGEMKVGVEYFVGVSAVLVRHRALRASSSAAAR